MTLRIRVLVTDTSPLITLAAADALDALLLLGLPVTVPDAVCYEATIDGARLGAAQIIDWLRKNADQVSISPTQIFSEEQLLARAMPDRKRSRDVGERAVFEIIDDLERVSTGETALVLLDDRDAAKFFKQHVTQAVVLKTPAFLRLLEVAGLIPSAQDLLRKAEEKGRHSRPADPFAGMPEEAKKVLMNVLKKQP